MENKNNNNKNNNNNNNNNIDWAQGDSAGHPQDKRDACSAVEHIIHLMNALPYDYENPGYEAEPVWLNLTRDWA